MKYLPFFMLICLPFFLTHCSTTERVTLSMQEDESSVDFSEYRNLHEYLRNVRGVDVRGFGENVNIRIRDAQEGDNPLFVIDGREMGRNYAETDRAFHMRDVIAIHIHTDDAGYGSRGMSGVIEIMRE